MNNFHNNQRSTQFRKSSVNRPANGNNWSGQSMARPKAPTKSDQVKLFFTKLTQQLKWVALHLKKLKPLLSKVNLQFLKSKPQNQKANLRIPKSETLKPKEIWPLSKPDPQKQTPNLQFPKFEPQKQKPNLQFPKSKIQLPKMVFKWNITSVLGVMFVFFACLTMITTMVAFAKQFSGNKTASAASVEEEYIPVEVTPNFDNQIKVLLLGSDIRPNDGSYRTDAILMIVLDPELMKINVVSFPRDLWVQVPGLWEMKINQVMQIGGFESVAGMFEANFGVRPDYYVMTNFNGFKQFIDNRGGVDVNVASDFSDTCDLPLQDAHGNCNLTQGTVHMDGPTALWYVRARTTSNDLDRTRREQEVLFALAKKLVSFQSITHLSSMKNEIQDNVETNMTIEQAIKLMPFVGMVLNQPEKINSISIGEDHAYPMWSWDGMWILMPETDVIRNLLSESGIKLN